MTIFEGAQLAVLGLTIIINLLLALVVIRNNRRSASNRIFGILSFTISAWLVVYYLSLQPNTSWDATLLLIRLSIFLATPMTVLFFLLAHTLPQTTFRLPRARLLLITLLTLIVMGITISPFAFTGLEYANGSFTPTPGPGLLFFSALTSFFSLAAVYVLRRNLRRAVASERQKLRFVVAGISTMLILIIVTIAIPVAVFKFSFFVPFAPVYSLAFVGLTAYAIVRHRLFDIKLIVARSAVYLFVLVTMAAAYALTAFAVSPLFFTASSSRLTQNIASTALAVILAFTFQPLRTFFERVTNRIFYRFHYDSQAVLNNFSKILVSELDLDRILKLSLTQLCDSLHIQFAQVIVYNQDRVYRIEHYGPLPKRLMIAPELAKLDKPMLIADELDGGERKMLMEGHGVRVAMTLRTREEFVGHLLLGDKLSGDIYSSQDIQLLEIIGKELAVAIQNAKAYAIIQEFNATLQAKVERSTNRLRVANRHLKELDKAKDEFISMASHQLRTPLTTIKGYLSMMQEGDAGPISDGQKQFVTYAFDASQRMVNLISDLLNVSRMSAGRFLIQTHPTDMVQMIDDEVRQLQSHARTKSLALVFDHPANPLPLIEIDEGKTRQVIMNFIDNAIYYTQTGEVRVVLEQTGDRVRLEVRDTGIGVPKDAQKQLFTKFYRAENAQTVRPDGTGLGLYLAKRVIEDQGGTIIFKSTEGKGSTFGFELPLRKPTPPKKTEAKSDDTKQVDKKEDKAHARTQST